jgi:hypothetical protein
MPMNKQRPMPCQSLLGDNVGEGPLLNLEFCVTIYDHCRLTYWWSKFRQILKPGILCSSNHIKENAT